jgi:MYXO-CTERM domain-containing protein
MVLVSTGVARAGFVVTTLRAPLGPGSNFAGKDGVTLFIRNDGVGTTDPTFGADLIFYDVALSSTAANPQFFIHAWDGLGHNAITPSANTKADFGWRGFVYGDANRDGQVSSNDFGILTSNFGQPNRTWSTADFTGDHQVSSNDFGLLTTNFAGPLLTAGSYVRFGSAAQFDSFFPLSTSPGESSQTFTDGQSVTGFDVTTLSLSSTTPGLPDSVATQLAFAVVPTGQPVTFTWSAAGHTGPTSTNFITDGGGGLSPAAVPEPAALGLVGLCGLLLARRRS